MSAGAFLDVVVACWTVSGARPRAIQILPPEQKLDGVIASGHVGFDIVSFLQRAGQESWREIGRVDLLAIDGDRRVRDHVQRVQLVLKRCLAILCGDVVNQTFVERPGIHATFPVIDDWISETQRFRLLVGYARVQPGLSGCLHRFVGRRFHKLINCCVELLRCCQRVFVGRQRQISVVRRHRRHVFGRRGRILACASRRFFSGGRRAGADGDREGRRCNKAQQVSFEKRHNWSVHGFQRCGRHNALLQIIRNWIAPLLRAVISSSRRGRKSGPLRSDSRRAWRHPAYRA